MELKYRNYLYGWYGDLNPDACMAPEHYCRCIEKFEAQPVCDNAIVLLGDSITELAGWKRLLNPAACGCSSDDGCAAPPVTFNSAAILNRGIAGDMIEGMILRLDEIARHSPSMIFLMAACNNFVKHPSISTQQVWSSYCELLSEIVKRLPSTKLFVAGTLPLNPVSGDYYNGINEKIMELNNLLQEYSTSMGYMYYDVASLLSDDNGSLRADLTIDGCHLNGRGYRIWAEKIRGFLTLR